MIHGWGRSAAGAAGALLLLAAGSLALAFRAWQRRTAELVGRLRVEAVSAPAPTVPTPEELAALPAPVARYFTYALGPESPVRLARVAHAGTFRTRPGARASRFTSIQNISAVPRGFVWDAAISMLPLIPVRVRDSYLGGKAGVDGRIGGLIPVVREAGTPELASGALARWLGEAVWLPTALLPGPDFSWAAIDDRSARATLTDRGIEVSMVAHFGAAGEIVRITAERYREEGGRGVLTPWLIELGDYTHTGGMMVPMSGSVSWELPGGRFEYWKARIVDVEYER